jgi:hypothetical protein
VAKAVPFAMLVVNSLGTVVTKRIYPSAFGGINTDKKFFKIKIVNLLHILGVISTSLGTGRGLLVGIVDSPETST